MTPRISAVLPQFVQVLKNDNRVFSLVLTLNGDSVAVGDLDGDSDYDLVAGSDLWRNDGMMSFVKAGELDFMGDQISPALLGQFIGDELLDLIYSGALWQNKGGFQFTLIPSWTENAKGNTSAEFDLRSSSSTDYMAAGYLNVSDKITDLFIGNSAVKNDGAGHFELLASTPSYPGSRFRGIALGDVDSDGDVDAVFASIWSTSSASNVVALNDGSGHFPEKYTYGVSDSLGVALGDLDGDGDLDVFEANFGSNKVWFNTRRNLFREENVSQQQDVKDFLSLSSWNAIRKYESNLWNLNGDGILDEVQATSSGELKINMIDGSMTVGQGPRGQSAKVTAGDLDQDGDRDLVAAYAGGYMQDNPLTDLIWRNEGGLRFTSVGYLAAADSNAISLADMDGDGNLDLVVATNAGQPNTIWKNDGNFNFEPLTTLGNTASYAVATGDLDGDGDHDIFLQGTLDPEQIWINQGRGEFELAAEFLASKPGTIEDFLLDDLDQDGDWDAVLANDRASSLRVFRNTRNDFTSLFVSVENPESALYLTDASGIKYLAGPTIPITYTISTRDGTLPGYVRACYSLNGGGYWLPAYAAEEPIGKSVVDYRSQSGCPVLSELESVRNVSLGQQIFRWDLEASGFFGQSDNVVFRIEIYPSYLPRAHALPGPYSDTYVSAWTRPFRVQGMQVRVEQEVGGQSDGMADAVVYQATAGDIRIASPIQTQSDQPLQTDPNGYLPGRGSLAISDTLAALWPTGIISATTPTRFYLSHSAPISVTRGTTVTAQLTLTETRRIGDLSLSLGITHTQGANLGVTLISPGQTSTPLITDTQVFTETYLSLTLPVDTVQGEMAGGDWTLEIENRGTTEAVLDYWGLEAQLSNLYYTSAAPTSTGLKMVEVQQGGVQTLTVSAENPLYLFDLDVALEWDARNDPQYLSQLAIDLRRASEYLFDWTNGGLALGKIRVFHNAKAAVGQYEGDPWLDSHIRIYATNRLRPSAAQGGIVTQVITDSVQKNADAPVVYGPGQVQIGATWNRFGDSSGNLGEDWPRILAHELGHYLLFLDDNYLGINSDPKSPFVGLLDSVTGCSGAMADPYTDDQSGSFKGEFFGVDDVKWIGECENTLSNQQTGRSDWETILTFYPELAINSQGTHDSDGKLTQIGPSRLPIAVTTVEFVPLAQPADTLDIPIFYLTDDKTKTTAQPGEGSRAFLFTGKDFEGENNWINDLGRPRQDQVLARGAAPGDTLCVFDPAGDRQGCGLVKSNAEGLSLIKTVWQPDVTITPLGSNQITVTVTAIPNGVKLLKARIYPTDLPASQVLSLTVEGLTATTVFSLEAPAASGYVHVWIADNPDVAYPDSVITDFSVGGTPEAGAEQTGYAFARARAGYAFARSRAGFAFARGRAGFAFARGRAGFAFARARTGFGYTKARYAPAVSTDGQVILFKQGDFPEGQFVTIQSVLNVPKLPTWATLVGHAYRLIVSSQDLALSDTITDTVISFGYLGNEVPAGEELWLKIYHLKDACVGDASDLDCWTPLETAVDMAQNQASAKVDDPGIYAMFSTVAINLKQGWNLIGYPVQGTRLVTEALASIAGAYSVVYGFDKNDSEDPWNVYIPDAEPSASDLKEMRFGQGYLIRVDKEGEDELILRIKGNTQETQTLTTTVSGAYLTSPPAIYYGTVTSQMPGFTVMSGMVVEAYVDETSCGEGRTIDDEGNFVVKVRAATESEKTCGAPNHSVSFRVESYPTIERSLWDVTQPHTVSLNVTGETTTPIPPPTIPPSPSASQPTTAACREIVQDGSFDGASSWARPLTPSQATVEDLGDGQRVLLLGVGPQDAAPRGLAYSTAYQDILIPYRIASATLTFDYRSDGQAGDQGHFLQIQGLDRSVKMTEYLTGQADLDTFQSFDLTPFRGTWVRLFFQVTNDGRSAPRWMTVDNVSLQVCD